MDQIAIPVTSAVAERWRQATPAQRQRVQKALLATLLSPEELAREIGVLLDRIGAAVAEAGWTPEY